MSLRSMSMSSSSSPSSSSSSAATFGYSETYPSVGSLRAICSFDALHREELVADSSAKRRGGPKKASLTFDIATDGDSLAHLPSQRVTLQWKMISQKNFSNKQNISQYSRAVYVWYRVADVMIVLSASHSSAVGVASRKLPASVGVNMAGDEQHPRFLLSSGKGSDGASTTFAVYHADADARVVLADVKLEAKELRVSFTSTSDAQSLTFSPNYRARHVASGESHATSLTTTPKTLSRSSQSSRFTPPVDERVHQRVAAAAAAATSPSASLSVLPPAEMPARLRGSHKRSRQLVSPPPADEDAIEERATSDEWLPVKRECHRHGGEAMSFADMLDDENHFVSSSLVPRSIFFDSYGQDAASCSSSSSSHAHHFQPPVAVEELMIDESSAYAVESQLTDNELDGGNTPLSAMSDESHATFAQMQSPDDDLQLMLDTCQDEDERLDQYQSRAHSSVPCAPFDAPSRERAPSIPFQLSTATLPFNEYRFTAFDPSSMYDPLPQLFENAYGATFTCEPAAAASSSSSSWQ